MSEPPRRSPWRRRLAIAGGILLAIVVVVGFLVMRRVYQHIGARGPGVVANGTASDFALPDQRGGTASLAELTANGPAVLVFYRGYW